MTTSIYSMVTDRIINNLSKGLVPWRKPWYVPANMNFITKKPYKGINAVMTGLYFYSNPYWITFLQAKELGLSIKKGETATQIMFYKELNHGISTMIDEETGDELISLSQPKSVLKYSNIFNLDQTDYQSDEERAFEPILHCEDIYTNMRNKPEIKEGGSICGYDLKDDILLMPPKKYFDSAQHYYNMFFHELIHSTGHWSRLNRDNLKNWQVKGDSEYSKEELTAEIGASFLCAYTGIDNSVVDNQTAYINGWLSALQNDKTLIFQASAKAQSAVDYILQNNMIES